MIIIAFVIVQQLLFAVIRLDMLNLQFQRNIQTKRNELFTYYCVSIRCSKPIKIDKLFPSRVMLRE